MADRESSTIPSQYVGIDLSGNSLKIARKRYPRDQWLVADACLLPFDESTFDIVAFSSVLHHIVGFADAVREAVRVLRPGGRIFAYDPNVLHPAMALFRHPRSPLYSQSGVSPDEKPLAARQLAHVFRTCGLVDLHQRAQSDIPYRYVAPKMLNALLSLYNRCDRLWDQCGLGYWFGTFIITAAQKPIT
jgi:SAM-dependent methyltransferase